MARASVVRMAPIGGPSVGDLNQVIPRRTLTSLKRSARFTRLPSSLHGEYPYVLDLQAVTHDERDAIVEDRSKS